LKEQVWLVKINYGSDIMFNFEKFVNSAFFRYADLLFKIVFVNVMVVIFSLPIITFIPALVAGYEQIKSFIEEKETPLFKSYIKSFKKNFSRNFFVGLIVMIVIGLLGLNIQSYYLQIEKGMMYIIGLYISLILLFFILIMTLHIPLSCVYFPHLNTKGILKISFYIGMKYIFTSITLLIPLVMTILLASYSFPIYTFIGIGIPIYISLKLSIRIYKKLERA
jgi:uncharacterized membrane protein YesL